MAVVPRPAAFTTLVLTDDGPDTLMVGAAVGSPVATGGLNAGLGTFKSVRTTTPDAILIEPGVPDVVTAKLYNNSGNLYWNGAPLASGGSISGTTNNVPRFTGTNTLGNSAITDSGAGLVTVNAGLMVNSGTTIQGALRLTGNLLTGPSAISLVNGATGKIPAMTVGYFDSLNGSEITHVRAWFLGAGTHNEAYVFSNPANIYYGIGSQLTQLNASELIHGTLPDGRLAGTYNQAITLNGVQTLVVAGIATVNGWVNTPMVVQTGEMRYTAVAGNNNDVAIGTAAVLYVDTTAGAANLTGMANGSRGRTVIICPTGFGAPVTIKAGSTASAQGNRFTSPGNTDQVIQGGGGRLAIYDHLAGVWRLITANIP